MNYSLREGKPSKKALLAANALMKAPLLKPGMQLVRKHGLKTQLDKDMLANLTPGSIVSEKGILSTSTKQNAWGGEIRLNITIGKGVRGLPARSFSQSPSESEVILPPGTKFMIQKVSKPVTWGVTVDVLALPTSDDQCCPP